MLYNKNIKGFVNFIAEFTNLISINNYLVFLKKEEINSLAIKFIYFIEKYITRNQFFF